MKNKRNIIIIIGIVFIWGLLIQVTRLDYVFQLGISNNALGLTKNHKKINAITEDEIKALQKENFMILYDAEETNSVKIKDHVSKVLDYMKKDYTVLDIKDYRGLDKEYHIIILTFENLKKFSGIDEISNYVFNGGNVFFAQIPIPDSGFYKIYRKLGIYETGYTLETDGIKLLSNILINGKDYAADEDFIKNISLPVGLKKECNVHAVSSNNIPLLWDTTYGAGRFMVFNGTMLYEKNNRGIIAGAISKLKPDFIYPIMNMKLNFIDDFPAPIPETFDENIYKEYGRSIPNFYREIWWPYILEGAKQYGLKYNGMIIESYNDRVEPPFDEDLDIKTFVIYGREILKSGGELGIHGYNHQSLAEKGYIKRDLGYKPWKKQEDMIAATREVNDYVKSIFPGYTLRSYVPPSNILSPTGREALIKAMPDLKIISSLYLDGYTNDAYIQEFEVGKNGIIELPRVTDGYENSLTNNWSILNAITTIGVYSHFIHPDDIFDPDRNHGKSWESLSKDYNALLKITYEKYKWLRNMTISQGGFEVEKYSQSKVYIEQDDYSIKVYCNNFINDMYFVLRTNKKILFHKDYDGMKIDEGVYLIHAKKASFTIELGR